MPHLDQLTKEQKNLLIALPYRVGLWISLSDETGGDESHAAEMQTLEAMLTGYVEDCCKSELAEEIFRETLNKKDHWDQWRGNIEKITEECQESVRMLRAYFPPTEVDPFQASLMEIATNIAMAYHEGGPPPSTLTIFLSRLRERFGRKQYESLPALHAHISRAERQAILALAEALHMPASSSPKST